MSLVTALAECQECTKFAVCVRVGGMLRCGSCANEYAANRECECWTYRVGDDTDRELNPACEIHGDLALRCHGCHDVLDEDSGDIVAWDGTAPFCLSCVAEDGGE